MTTLPFGFFRMYSCLIFFSAVFMLFSRMYVLLCSILGEDSGELLSVPLYLK